MSQDSTTNSAKSPSRDKSDADSRHIRMQHKIERRPEPPSAVSAKPSAPAPAAAGAQGARSRSKDDKGPRQNRMNKVVRRAPEEIEEIKEQNASQKMQALMALFPPAPTETETAPTEPEAAPSEPSQPIDVQAKAKEALKLFFDMMEKNALAILKSWMRRFLLTASPRALEFGIRCLEEIAAVKAELLKAHPNPNHRPALVSRKLNALFGIEDSLSDALTSIDETPTTEQQHTAVALMDSVSGVTWARLIKAFRLPVPVAAQVAFVRDRLSKKDIKGAGMFAVAMGLQTQLSETELVHPLIDDQQFDLLGRYVGREYPIEWVKNLVNHLCRTRNAKVAKSCAFALFTYLCGHRCVVPY